jgi:E3 ubiquitin-protein ligase DMA1/2
MISPPAAVPPPAAADPTVNRTTSARRRGLSYLRALSHNRNSGGTSPNEPSRSPRHYFQRSLSYNDNRPDPATTRRRSISRPNEPTIPLSPGIPQSETRSRSPPASRPQALQDPTLEQVEQDKPDEMARHRSSTSRQNASNSVQTDVPAVDTAEPASRPANPRTTSKTASGAEAEPKQQLPTIRFFPHQEIRNGRPSLNFSPVSRTLPGEHSIIRVGRYSEREGVPSANPTGPSDAPVGFKSKVVSRKHCEFSFLDGQWQIKDVASSSGTFLNHIRLSQPNTESRLFPIKDGDIVQLGIDFRGGEEMIFRCVKIRIECNRAWQKKANNFK